MTKPEINSKIALIDADILAWRCACVAEKKKYMVTYDHDEGRCGCAVFNTFKEAQEFVKHPSEYIWNRTEDKGPEFAREVLDTTIKSIIDKLVPTEIEYYLSAESNFRYEVAKTKPYKGHRKNKQDPKYLDLLKGVLKSEFGAKEITRLEADDAIGIRHMGLSGSRAVQESVIVSIDKDLDQLPGWHFDWVKDKLYRVSKREADFNLFTQVLVGDATDDVPGLPGCGPVKAREILASCKSSRELYERSWDAYRAGGYSFEYFSEQYRLVYILRSQRIWELGGALYGMGPEIKSKESELEATNAELTPTDPETRHEDNVGILRGGHI
jgi:hypothetical protein